MSGQTMQAILMTDTAGRIVHWNDNAETLFGYSADETIGETLDVIIPEDFREQHWAGFNRAIESGVCKIDRASMNAPVLLKNGEVQSFPATFVFLQGPRGDVVGLVGLFGERNGAEEAFGDVLPLR